MSIQDTTVRIGINDARALDEMFEMLTLAHTHAEPAPVVTTGNLRR